MDNAVVEQSIDKVVQDDPAQRRLSWLTGVDVARRSTRVVVLEDGGLIGESIRCGLTQAADITIVTAAVSRRHALHAIAQWRPAVLIIDLQRAARSVIEDLQFCRRLTQEYPSVGILAMTRVPDERLVAEANRSGARGHISVNATAGELVLAIREVAAGRRLDEAKPNGIRLTNREYEVLRLVAHGKTNMEISEALWISSRTVKFHVQNVMRKLETLRRAEMVFAASQRGLL